MKTSRFNKFVVYSLVIMLSLVVLLLLAISAEYLYVSSVYQGF